MIVYNITYAIPHGLHEAWLQWMKDMHIPEIMSTGHFLRFQMMQLMDMDEKEGLTYAVQFFAASEKECNDYLTKSAPALRLKASAQWGDQIVGFRTRMRIVH